MGSRCGPLPRSLRQVIHPVCRTADFIKRKAKSKSIRAKRHIRNPLDTLRLGVYSDLSYRQDNEGISSTTPSFTAWLGALSSEVDELVSIWANQAGASGLSASWCRQDSLRSPSILRQPP